VELDTTTLHYICLSVTSVPVHELITEYWRLHFGEQSALHRRRAHAEPLEYFINVSFRFLPYDTCRTVTDCDKSYLFKPTSVALMYACSGRFVRACLSEGLTFACFRQRLDVQFSQVQRRRELKKVGEAKVAIFRRQLHISNKEDYGCSKF